MQVIRALLDLCRVGTTTIRKRCVAAIWNMTNVEQGAPGGGSAAESIPLLLVSLIITTIIPCYMIVVYTPVGPGRTYWTDVSYHRRQPTSYYPAFYQVTTRGSTWYGMYVYMITYI